MRFSRQAYERADTVPAMRRTSSALAVAAVLFLGAACGSSNSSSGDAGVGGDAPLPSQASSPSGSAAASEPELTAGQSVSYTGTNGEQLQITLTAPPTFEKATKEDIKITHEDSSMTRIGTFPVKIQNTGSVPFKGTSFGGAFVSDQGEQFDFSGVTCDKDDLDFDTLAPGRFAQGNLCYFLPADSGHLEFADPDATTTPFYIGVPAS